MFDLLEFGRDDERAYLSFFVLRLDKMQLTPRALIGIEIVNSCAIEGRGIVLDILFIRIKFY